jgi:FMNH2-dependent dimethyl sulfone monooxygenase
MHFGLYAPIPNVALGSRQIAQSIAEALKPLQPGQRDLQFDHCADVIKAAETAGFDICLFAERHLGSDMTAWVLASGVAPRLESMRVLVAVHPGLWDPVITAKLAVSLDRMCKGRMALNIVNGWYDEEFKMFGGMMLQGEERYQRTSEFINILRGLWTQDVFSFTGQHYKVDKGRLLLKPATEAPPEIFSVSRSDRGLNFIANYCDWWFIETPANVSSNDEFLRDIEKSIKDMTRRMSSAGRKVRFAFNPFLALGESEEAAFAATLHQIEAYNPNSDPRNVEQRMLPATRAGCIGPARKVLEQLRRFSDMGVELMLCKLISTVENVELIGRDVIEPLNGSVPLHLAS